MPTAVVGLFGDTVSSSSASTGIFSSEKSLRADVDKWRETKESLTMAG